MVSAHSWQRSIIGFKPFGKCRGHVSKGFEFQVDIQRCCVYFLDKSNSLRLGSLQHPGLHPSALHRGNIRSLKLSNENERLYFIETKGRCLRSVKMLQRRDRLELIRLIPALVNRPLETAYGAPARPYLKRKHVRRIVRLKEQKRRHHKIIPAEASA